MTQSSIVKIIFIQAIIAYCCDFYIVIKNAPGPISLFLKNPIALLSTEVLAVIMIVLFVRIFMYWLLAIQSKKNGADNLVLLFGSIIITTFGIYFEFYTKGNRDWEFLCIPIQFFAIFILRIIIGRTHHSSGTPNGAP